MSKRNFTAGGGASRNRSTWDLNLLSLYVNIWKQISYDINENKVYECKHHYSITHVWSYIYDDGNVCPTYLRNIRKPNVQDHNHNL